MEEIKRIYTLLSHSNGLKIKEIAKVLEIDRYHVADILFSTDNIPFWFQDSSSLWFAKEGAIEIEEPKVDKLTEPIIVPKVINTERFIQGHTSGALKSFLNHLSKYRVYSDDELLELFKRYRDGDKKAYDLIVKSHQKLVAGIAVLYAKYGIPLEDLIQEGNIGLIRAIERFDYLHFRSFHHFAKAWILQAISFSMTTLPYTVRLPLNQMLLYRKVRKFKEKYEQQNGYLPSVSAIEIDNEADFEKISFVNELPDSLKELTVLSRDLDIYENPSNTTEEMIETEYNKELVGQYLKRLRQRERYILQSYFGINAKEETLSSIGDRYALTRERVRQIVWKTIGGFKERSRIKTEEVKLGDTIKVESSKQTGRVIDYKISPNGYESILLKMEDGHTIRVSGYNPPYEIITHKMLKEKKSHSKQSVLFEEKVITTPVQKENRSQYVQRYVCELDGIKVGERIRFNGKECFIRKIIVRGTKSKFLVEYNNQVLDYVPNDKSRYSVVDSTTKCSDIVSRQRKLPLFGLSTTLDNLVKYGIITTRQLHQCHKKKLRTIGDVKKIIEKYNLTPDSTRFTKYTLDMWFGIVGLLNSNV